MIILGFEIKDGCCDSSCRVKIPTGINTQATCRCIPNNISNEDRILIVLMKLKIPKYI